MHTCVVLQSFIAASGKDSKALQFCKCLQHCFATEIIFCISVDVEETGGWGMLD